MDGRNCLAWCLEYGHRFPQDWKTARHVLDWLADKANQEAATDAELQAVERARMAATEVVRDQR